MTNIALDYRNVAVDVTDKANKHPFKAICWSTDILCPIPVFRICPDKQDYIDTLMRGAKMRWPQLRKAAVTRSLLMLSWSEGRLSPLDTWEW